MRFVYPILMTFLCSRTNLDKRCSTATPPSQSRKGQVKNILLKVFCSAKQTGNEVLMNVVCSIYLFPCSEES